jgi:cold shock protein
MYAMPARLQGMAPARYAGAMASGEVLWFDTLRGFGFIRPDMGPRDVFVHQSALAETGVDALGAGERVEFELIQMADGRPTAFGVKLQMRPAASRGAAARGQRRG